MDTIHKLIKRRKSTNLVFQRCENKSSFFSVNKWILLLGKNSKRYNVCKRTYKVCTTTCDHRKLLWQIKVEASCSSQVAVLELRWVANKFSNIYILICEKLATNKPPATRQLESSMEKFERRTNPADQPEGILNWFMPPLHFVNANNSNRK